MHPNDDDLAVTLKDLHVDETLVDPPVAGIDPLEGTVFSPEEVADVNRHVFEPAATPLEKALTVLAQAFLEDDGPASYRHSWVANMAMCFFDEMGKLVDDKVERYGDIHVYRHEIRDVANASAERFISLLLKNIKTTMRKPVETTPHDLDVDEKGCISICLPSFDELLKETETLSRETLVFNYHHARELKREYFMRLLHAADVEAELSRQVEFLLAEKEGLARRVDEMNRDLDVLRLGAMRVNDVRLDEAIKERDEAIYHGQQIRKELDAAKKELFEVAIQMKNAAAHARHLVDAIDEFDRELALPHATPYMCITRFLNKARSYSGNTETKQ